MRFSDILLTSLLGAASAYTIPENTEDGVYKHYVDSDGNYVHIKVANATNYDSASLQAYAPGTFAGCFKRQQDIAHCAVGNELDYANTDAANVDLDWQCGHDDPTAARHNFYSIRGNVVAVFCNFHYDCSHKCSSASPKYTSGLITQKCG